MLELNCTLNFAGTKATGADVDALNFSIDNGTHALNIRLPFAFGLQVRVAHVHAGHRAFLTNFAVSRHVNHLFSEKDRRILAQKTLRRKALFYFSFVRPNSSRWLAIINVQKNSFA